MEYLEISFKVNTPGNSEIIAAYLADIGLESFMEAEKELMGYIQKDLFSLKIKNEILALQKVYFFEFSIGVIQERNWNAEWEKNYPPVTISDKCRIRASFHVFSTETQYDLVINPKMAFGTGHHETTNLVIRQLLNSEIKNKNVCDAGCGTCILGILAYKMGARSVFAYDIDECSVKNSIENINANNAAGIVVKKGGVQLLSGRTFHVILANINRNVLLNDMECYANCLEDGGVLIVSGFYESDIPMVTEKAVSTGLFFCDRSAKNSWSMLSFQKNQR